jgi:hypothetical protein
VSKINRVSVFAVIVNVLLVNAYIAFVIAGIDVEARVSTAPPAVITSNAVCVFTFAGNGNIPKFGTVTVLVFSVREDIHIL